MTGMSISEIEKQLPNMQEQINSANQKYNSLLQLAELKTQRDAANGMAAYEQINTQYQAALQAAGLDETSADAMYAQLDSMQTEINNSQAQYEQLCAVVNAKKT